MSPEGQRMAATAALMAFWWVTETVPIAVTALLPLALFPLLGIADAKTSAAPYANHLIFLFMGGFLIAIAIQRWNLHRRIALRTIKLVGFSQAKLVLGFMVSTAASCAFMLPVATPPNSIIFGSGQVTIPVRAKKGFALNILGIMLITMLTYLLLVPLFGIVMGEMPKWVV